MITDGYVDSWFWMHKPERHWVRGIEFSLLQRFLGSPCIDWDSFLYNGDRLCAGLCVKRRHPKVSPLEFCRTRFSSTAAKNYEIRRYLDMANRLHVPVHFIAYDSNLAHFYLWNDQTMKTMDLIEFSEWYGNLTGIPPNIPAICERAPIIAKICDKLLEAELRIKEVMPRFIRGLFK